MRQRLWAAAVAGLSFVGACGGQSERADGVAGNPDSGSGGVAGTGGHSAAGGAPTGGTTGGSAAAGGTTGGSVQAGGVGGTLGGSPPDAGTKCPAESPRTIPQPPCDPAALPPEGCTYELECQSGPQSFVYRCDERGWWSVDGSCSFPYDSCWGGDAQVRCNGEEWNLMGWGGDPPQDCAVERPLPGSECVWNQLSPPSTCGYRCPDGTGWTVASCVFEPVTDIWLLDGACAGDCSAHERALLDYVAMHRGCEADADCRYLKSFCAFTREHCSGAFAVGPSVDPAEFERLAEALDSCASEPDSGWPCAACEADPEPDELRCVDSVCTLDG